MSTNLSTKPEGSLLLTRFRIPEECKSPTPVPSDLYAGATVRLIRDRINPSQRYATGVLYSRTIDLYSPEGEQMLCFGQETIHASRSGQLQVLGIVPPPINKFLAAFLDMGHGNKLYSEISNISYGDKTPTLEIAVYIVPSLGSKQDAEPLRLFYIDYKKLKQQASRIAEHRMILLIRGFCRARRPNLPITGEHVVMVSRCGEDYLFYRLAVAGTDAEAEQFMTDEELNLYHCDTYGFMPMAYRVEQGPVRVPVAEMPEMGKIKIKEDPIGFAPERIARIINPLFDRQ